MIYDNTDDALDARLRDVPLPPGLLVRLSSLAGDAEPPTEAADDRRAEQRLRDVDVRPDFLAELRAIPCRSHKKRDRALVVAKPLEDELCEVPLPRGLGARLRAIARPTTALRLTPWSVAAGILLLVTVAGIGVLVGRASRDLPAVAHSESANDESSTGFLGLLPVDPADSPAIERLDAWLGDETAAPPEAPGQSVSAGQVVAQVAWPVEWSVAGVSSDEGPVAAGEAHLRPGSPEAAALLLDANVARLRVFAADRAFDDEPELWTMPGLRPRGIDPPTNREFDLLFLRRHGVQPFVLPTWLPQISIPLSARPESYDLARRCVATGTLPRSDSVRTEEFLAAPNYRYRWPEPVGSPLSIRAAAGPAPLARMENVGPLSPPLHALHVGVQAAEMARVERPPADVIVVVDLSSSMRWGGRLDMVRAALHEQVSRMQEGDRWTLVAFSEQAWVVVSDVPRSEQGALHEAIESLYARTSTNVGAGLELARLLDEDRAAQYDITQSTRARHVILLSDGLSQLDATGYDVLRERFQRRAADDVRLTLVALGVERVADAQWLALAGETQGRFVRAASAMEIGWGLSEAIDGRSPVVAHGVTMRVVFDPAQVESYRLFGHESSPVADLMPLAPEVEFRSGQTGVAMFELKLKDLAQRDPSKRETIRQDLTGGDVATVFVQWRDPASGELRTLQQGVSRRQFAPTFSESAPALQRAVLAAGAAEVLRGSYFARGVKLDDVSALAQQLPPAIAAEPDVAQLVKLIQDAARLLR